MMQRRRRLTTGQKVAIGGGALVFLGFAGWLYGGDYLRQRELAFGRAAEAKVDGPPCPPATAADLATRRMKVPS